MNRFPVQVHAHREDHLSRWLWLVRCLLLIPHYVILIVLWIGFVVTTLLAYVAVLFTGRYPSAIFAFNGRRHQRPTGSDGPPTAPPTPAPEFARAI
jgi:hypothetical protein